MKGATKYRLLMIISALSLVITSPISWNYFDLHLFLLTWNDQFAQSWNLYAVSNTNYPPLSTYLFALTETIARATAANPFVVQTNYEQINWVRTITRIPLIASFLWTGRLLFKQWGWNVARFWLLTPPVLVAALLFEIHPVFAGISLFAWTAMVPVNVFFGYQFDLLAVPFTLIALFALKQRDPVKFGGALALGALLKFYPLILLPLGLARFNLRQQSVATAICGSIGVVVCAPFLLTTPDQFFYQLFGFQGERFPQGLSLYHIPLLALQYNISSFPDILQSLWKYIWLPVYGCLVVGTWFQPESPRRLTLSFGAVLLSLAVFNKIGNLNYIVWAWPFLLYGVQSRDISPRAITIGILTTSIYPLVVYIPAAILDKPILIMQRLEWMNARKLLLGGFNGIARPGISALLARANATLGNEFAWIYSHRFQILIILIAVHSMVFWFLLYQLATGAGVPLGLSRTCSKLRQNPQETIRELLVD